MNCQYCPNFSCKLKSDYSRHLLSTSHLANEKMVCNITSNHIRFSKVLNEIKNKKVESKDRLIERKLCLNREFIHRAFFPMHVYNTKELFVDIRDRFSSSRDKEFSYLNCDFFHTSVY